MNRNILNRILTNDYYFMPNHPNFRRAYLLNGMLVLFVFLMLVSGTINAVFGDFYFVYFAEFAASIISVLILIYFRHSNNLKIASLFFIVTVFTVSIIFFYFAHNIGYSLYWLSLVPFLFYFIADRKYAVIATIAFFVAFGVIMIYKPIVDVQSSNFVSVSNIVVASIIVVLLLIHFDLSGLYVSRALAKQNEKLKVLSETDSLTGLYNRLKINKIIEENIQKCKSGKDSFSIIMSDIDDFKSINDRFGHLMGDRVLIAISKIFREYAKECCIPGRWGGEEFIFVCCEKDGQEAVALAEQLKEKVGSYHILNGQMTSMSFGVATYDKDDDFESLLHRADIALYKAKAKGGGCVVCV